jgi:tRNA G46 methylase TrmB
MHRAVRWKNWAPVHAALCQEALDLQAAFGRSAPTVLEIGFGMGETSAKIAALMPKNFIGVEVHARRGQLPEAGRRRQPG